MRKVFALLVLGVVLVGGAARAEGPAAPVCAAGDLETAVSPALDLDPLQGAIPLLPRNCPVLCTNVQGTACSYGQAPSCYDHLSRKICLTCHCSGNNTFSCYPEA